jgi:pectate lyase
VTGGRGGQVIKVTTLAASGPGSLQAALDVDAPRIIVFEVSGVIDTDVITIPYGDVTIAGQTAPGGGITIKGRLFAEYDYGVQNIIVRHLRVRPEYDGSEGIQFDALQFSRVSRFILDHVSVAFGVDETIDLYEAEYATVQWSTIESSGTVGHPEGEHNYGMINGPDGRYVSVHHNLFAHHKNRCPAIANGPAEVVNNVIYDVRHGFVHHNPAEGDINIVGNYYKDGPSASLYPFWFDDESNPTDTHYYLADNWVDDQTAACQGSVDNPWSECSWDLYLDSSHRATSPFDFGAEPELVPLTVTASTEAYQAVLAGAGAFPRDVVSRGSVEDTQNRTGSWGATMPPNLMQGLSPASPPVDTDDDGIADAWEIAQGLDPTDPEDLHTPLGSGYPAIEQYINELADALIVP